MPSSPGRPPSDDPCVLQWLARDLVGPCPRSAAECARFRVIRRRLLRHLRRDPRMWVLQGRNVLRGLARLGLCLALAPPVLAFWEPLVWPAVVGVGFLGLGLLDILLGQRLSGFRNVFVERAERLAWAVVDTEPPAAGPAQRHPGAPEHDTKSAQ